MSRRTPTLAMTPSQQVALASAGEDGHLAMTDRRVMGSLVRKGWVRVVETRKRRKTLRAYVITDAGQDALAAGEVVQPRPRPLWRHWDREWLSEGHYLVEGHELVRPARTMLWRVVCPASPPGEPVAYEETLYEAVETLTTHMLHTCSMCLRTSGAVYCPAEPGEDTTRHTLDAPEPVDLDALVEQHQDGQVVFNLPGVPAAPEPLQLGLFHHR